MSKNKQIVMICLVLAFATLAAFWQVNQCDFIGLDDRDYVTENSHVQNGITMEGVRWAFTSGHASNWHPLTWISHMLDVQLFGLNPQGHHLINLLFHLINTLLLFFVFQRMTKALWRSFFVAALFALHPLHVESVAWVAERKDVLSTFFWMLTMYAYTYYAERPRIKSYLAVLAFFALGLLAKPMLVTLPFVLLLLDYWPLRRFEQNKLVQETRTEINKPKPVPANKRKRKSNGKPVIRDGVDAEKPTVHTNQWLLTRRLLLEKIPLFVLTALSCIATYNAQKNGGSVVSTEALSLGVRISNAFVSYVIYIGKTIWPNNLAVYYPHPGSWPFWQVMGAVLFLIAVTALIIRKARKFPYLVSGWLWFGGTLVPVIGIVQVGNQAMADRYTYIPLIGLFVIAAWGFPEFLKSRRYHKELYFAAIALILLSLFGLTWAQVGYWKNSMTLFDHTLEVTENNFLIHNNRGAAEAKLGHHKQAIEDYDRAIEINPRSALAYNNRGSAYDHLGNPTFAIADFGEAIEIDPKYAEAYNNRGAAHERLGSHTSAIADFDMAIEINPSYAEAYNNRGAAYDRLGNRTMAISDFDRAVEINPEYTRAYYNRGIAYNGMGEYARAIEDFDRAIRINPTFAEAFNNRGIANENLGNHTLAIEDFDKAIKFSPENRRAYFNRASAYSIVGNHSHAVEDLKAAARLGHEEARAFLKVQGINW